MKLIRRAANLELSQQVGHALAIMVAIRKGGQACWLQMCHPWVDLNLHLLKWENRGWTAL